MKKAWVKWVRIVKFVVSIQASIFLFIVYYLTIVPLSVLVKIFGKNSLLGHGHVIKENSYWITRRTVNKNLIWAKMQ